MSAKTKILFVDDEKQIRNLLTDAFDGDYEVYQAASGVTALKLIEKHGIRIIYTDLQMPKMDGVDLCKAIREHDMISIVCAITGYTRLFELQECREIGFDDYFKKPVDIAALSKSLKDSESKLKRWLNR